MLVQTHAHNTHTLPSLHKCTYTHTNSLSLFSLNKSYGACNLRQTSSNFLFSAYRAGRRRKTAKCCISVWLS